MSIRKKVVICAFLYTVLRFGYTPTNRKCKHITAMLHSFILLRLKPLPVMAQTGFSHVGSILRISDLG